MVNKELIKNAVASRREEMFTALDYIWQNPETGYKEWKTSEFMAEKFREMGYVLTMAGNIPGFYTEIDTGRTGPTVGIFSELDCVISPNHPCADKETGYVHACGHHAQSAAMLGIAYALTQKEILNELSGKIRLIVVPAEELLEIDYRESLREKGIIKYFGGKVEFLYRGYLDGVDMAFMIHTGGGKSDFHLPSGCNGCITKSIEYKGKAAHAGGSPDEGINALYAASMGLQAVNSLRETFRDDDHIRFHPVMTYGGGAVNVIPDRAVLESYVRGADIEQFTKVNKKVNRALAASAAAIGAKVVLKDRPGYMPLKPDKIMANTMLDVCVELIGEKGIEDEGFDTGCTDMGDISCVMPAIHPYGCGAVGAGHGADYYIDNKEDACTLSATVQVALVCRLLENGAEIAKKVVENSNPLFKHKEDYFRVLDSLELNKDAVIYNEDGTVTLSF